MKLWITVTGKGSPCCGRTYCALLEADKVGIYLLVDCPACGGEFVYERAET